LYKSYPFEFQPILHIHEKSSLFYFIVEKEDVKRLNLKNTQLKIELFCLLDSFESCLKNPLDQSLS